MTNKYTDDRPTDCRFRLMDEGKSYPRSSCRACSFHVFTGNGCQYEKNKAKWEGTSVIKGLEKQQEPDKVNHHTVNEYPPTKVTDDEPLSVLDEVALRILIALIHPDPADGVTWYAKAPEDAYIYAERFLQHRKGR